MENEKTVALLAEGVDRNIYNGFVALQTKLSPSSRRAWIEIADRDSPGIRPAGRPPRGGRG